MSDYMLFIDETDFRNDESVHDDMYCLVGLGIALDPYTRLAESWRSLKASLAERGIVRKGAEFHLTEIKKKRIKSDFEGLRDPQNDKVFWNELAEVIVRTPFFLTASIVYRQAVREASLVNNHQSTKMLAIGALLENAAVLASHAGIDRYLVTHESVQDDVYRMASESLLARIPSSGLRLLPKHQVSTLFHGKLSWKIKEDQDPGLELVDLCANPLLMRYLGFGPHRALPTAFVDDIWGRLRTVGECTHQPYRIRILP